MACCLGLGAWALHEENHLHGHHQLWLQSAGRVWSQIPGPLSPGCAAQQPQALTLRVTEGQLGPTASLPRAAACELPEVCPRSATLGPSPTRRARLRQGMECCPGQQLAVTPNRRCGYLLAQPLLGALHPRARNNDCAGKQPHPVPGGGLMRACLVGQGIMK